MTEKRHTWRLFLVATVVTAALGGLGARLAFLHLGPDEELRARVHRTRTREERIHVGRGRVLDRRGTILALDIPSKQLWVDPKEIHKKGHVRFIGTHLARLLQLEPAMIFSRLNLEDRRYERLKLIRTDLADQIARMKLTGVHFDDVSCREYPHESLACHVVGFVNKEDKGCGGVEQRWNSYLRGTPGLRVSEADGKRRELYDRRNLLIPAQEGMDVYLTLDATIQYLVEKALDEAMVTHNAKGAWAIVQHVRTGEILGMASRPAYDPNEYGRASSEEKRNRAISTVYEPGSTFKLAVIAAALDRGTVEKDQVIDCEDGYWVYRGRPLRDYHSYDELTVADVLKKSSNIGAAKIALAMGEKQLEDYLRNFGVGSPTGINLPGEESGIFHPRSRWSALSATRIAMGHEVGITALQMVNMVSAIANNGFLMRPIIVERVMDDQKRIVFEAQPEVLGRPIRQETATLMRELMARVTEKGGTGTRAALEAYRVAGKTGTAQKPIPGGYSDTAHMASFVGFLPVEDPELSIVVVVDDPQPVHTGGQVAAPVFKQIADPAMRYLASQPQGLESRYK